MSRPRRLSLVRCLTALAPVFLMIGCTGDISPAPTPMVPHQERWGIYRLDIATGGVELVYSSPQRLTGLDLNGSGDTFAFARRIQGDTDRSDEICTYNFPTGAFNQLTRNDRMDVYPVWSPDGTEILFLSWRADNLDIYIMDADGGNQRLLYDSGSHDADIDWIGEKIVFTSGSRIWIMDSEGAGARPLTLPPRAGEWGNANLPFGDYDPRLSPDGGTIVFERLEEDRSANGNYNIFTIPLDGSPETRLTDTGYSQGLANWSPDGEKLVFVVAAVNGQGRYDIYMMDRDGSGLANITPDYFPPDFLCHSPLFSPDGRGIYFIGEWWAASE